MGGEGDTYYRVLWLIPMGIITAYGGVKMAGWIYEKKAYGQEGLFME